MRSFYINNENIKYANQNIYKALGKMFPKLSVGNLNKVFRLKDVKVNSIRITKEYTLKEGDFVQVYLSDELLYGTSFNLKIVYEDKNILAVFKPISLECCNETHTYSKDELYLENIVRQEKGKNNIICHRLDTNTQGIVIFAKNAKSHQEVLKAFKEQRITKKYLALVLNKPPKNSDVLNAYLVKEKSNNQVKIYDTNVKNSVQITTEYKLLKYIDSQNISILEVTLHTGKTHQIRAHLSHIGLPIIGDPKYNLNEINKKYNAKFQQLIAYKYIYNGIEICENIDYYEYFKNILNSPNTKRSES